MKRATSRYALTGYVVSKLVMPVVKRQVKKKVRTGTVNTARAGAGAVRSHKVRSSVVLGSAIGAATYLLKRRGKGDSSDPRAVTRDTTSSRR